MNQKEILAGMSKGEWGASEYDGEHSIEVTYEHGTFNLLSKYSIGSNAPYNAAAICHAGRHYWTI